MLVLKGVKDIYHIFIYRPPDDNTNTFLTEVEILMYPISNKANYEVNIIGDININLHKIRDPNIKGYREFLKRNKMCNIIHVSVRGTRH